MMPSPSGIDFRPQPPRAVRLKRAIAVFACIGAAGIVAVLFYAIQQHAAVASASSGGDGKPGSVTPASSAAQKIIDSGTKGAAARSVAGSTGNMGANAGANGGGTLGMQGARPAQAPLALGNPQRTSQPAQYAYAPPPPQASAMYGVPTSAAGGSNPADAAAKLEADALTAPASFSRWSKLSAGPPAQASTPAQGDQDQKVDFVEAHRKAPSTALAAARVRASSPYEIKMGWLIPSVLESSMNSDLPGSVKARVRENVYDTATGRYLLIPSGSILVGAYDSHISYGQRGVQAVWYRIIFPDASSLVLDGFVGHDAQGAAGFRGKVDNHYKRLIGTALLTSAFFAGGALAQTRRGSVLGYPSPQEVAGTAAANNMSQQMVEVTRRNLDIQPTIVVPAGYLFSVSVDKDIVFEGPYTRLPPITYEQNSPENEKEGR